MKYSDADLADSVSRLQAVLYRLTKSLVFRDHPPPALAELPLSQLRCVRVLSEHEGEKMFEFAQHLGVTLPALSQIVDRLVHRGMVERHADGDDRRIVRLYLSDSAREVLRQGDEERRERIAKAVAGLSTVETETAVHSMERLAEAAEKSEPARATLDSDLAETRFSKRGVEFQEAAAGVSPIPVKAGQ